MYKGIAIICMIMILASISIVDRARAEVPSEEIIGELFAMSFEDILNVEIYTASKRLQKIPEAPSPVYVFTEEDIRRTGVRNIQELLKFIPGFYIYPTIDQPFSISNRGLRASRDDYLFLIDGIPLNSISKGGAVNEDLFPSLDKVKRVEVVSGPGSTLWGSDASLGIIHIITKDGKDIDGTIVNVDMATEDNHKQFNVISGKEFSGGEYMFSFTYAENDGFGHENNGFDNFIYDYDTVPWNDQRGNFNHIYPSYEIYGKVRLGDYTIKAMASEKNIYSFWGTASNTDYHDVQDKKSIQTASAMHIELSHQAQLSSDKILDTKVTAKQIEYIREQLVDIGTDHGSDFDDPDVEPMHRQERYPENGVGLELMLNWDINEKHDLLAGTRVRMVHAGPAEVQFYNLNTGNTPSDGLVRSSVYYHEVTDWTYGAYVEDTFRVNDSLTLIGGVRIDYNDPRETKSVIMPRGAAVYKFTDALSAKYMYNTGYVRPQVEKSFEVALSKQGSVEESEKIQSHDVAFIYNSDKTQLIVDLFYLTIFDISSYDPISRRQVNSGDIFSKGAQVSFKRSFLDQLLIFDLNYGYAYSEVEDDDGNREKQYNGIPHHVYAAGLDYNFAEKASLYTTVHGWADLEMDNARATSWIASEEHPDYAGDYLVDMNLRFRNLLNNTLDVSLYVLNVFDEKARLQAKSWHAWWSYARGRSIGTKIAYKF